MSAGRGGDTLDLPETLAVVVLTVGAGTGLILWTLSGLGTLISGHGWHPVPGDQLGHTVTAVPQHLGDLRHAYPEATAAQLPPSAILWLLFTVLVGAAVLATTLGLRAANALSRQEGQRGVNRQLQLGMASRRDLRVHLSDHAARVRAKQARPSLTGHTYPTSEVGLALGRDIQHHQDVWGSVEDSYLYLGPPRSGKGVHLVIPQALDASGALIVTSTRPDVLHATHDVREQRGPVFVFDPQGLAPNVPSLRWNPSRGCTDPLVAINRARALAAGSGLGEMREGQYW